MIKTKKESQLNSSPNHQGASTYHSITFLVCGVKPLFEKFYKKFCQLFSFWAAKITLLSDVLSTIFCRLYQSNTIATFFPIHLPVISEFTKQ
jgi:hypothetical protein